MCDQFPPYIPVARLIDCSGFGYSFICVNDSASENIQEIISFGVFFMCNYATVCGGKVDLTIVVRYLSERWKSLESESAMMLLIPLICW